MKVNVLVGSRDDLSIKNMIHLLFGGAEKDLVSFLSDRTPIATYQGSRNTGAGSVTWLLLSGYVLSMRKGRIVFYDPKTLSLNAKKRCLILDITHPDLIEAVARERSFPQKWPSNSCVLNSLSRS